MEMNYAIYEVKEGVREAVIKAFAGIGVKIAAEEAEVFEPRERQRGDLTVACFDAAKKLGKNSAELAKDIEAVLQEKKLLPAAIARCDAAGGYVNFFLSDVFFLEALNEILAVEEFGSLDVGKEKTIVLDYSCPNVGKPLHIGHIRSTIYGDSLKRILERVGYCAVGVNYLGDSGAQVAKLVLATRRYKELPCIKSEKDLLGYYTKIHGEIEEKPELKLEVEAILEAIEAGDASTLEEVSKIRKMSLDAFNKTYSLLGVGFDVVTGESKFIEYAKKIAREALDKGIACRGSEGELKVDLSPYKLEDVVILRSNGTTLYPTRDLALAEWKYKQYKFEESIYIAGSEQQLHFRQVFKILELLGRSYAGKCRHVPFGLVFLAREAAERVKISTRAGEVLLLEDVLHDAVKKAKEEIKAAVAREEQAGLSNRPRLAGGELEATAAAVAVAALKFAVLRVGAEKEIFFSPEQATRFQGDTGAYLQYMHVRCNGILGKAGAVGAAKLSSVKLNEKERALLIQLARFPSVVENCASSLAPHLLCNYLLKLSRMFSEFYETTPVLKAESEKLKTQRLALVQATKKILKTGLELLGIEALEKM